jgi:phosphoesterase RecJ-like protein
MRLMDLGSLKELLHTPKKIVITTHHKPDGDAMGSSLGLYNYLILKGHSVTVVTPNDYPTFLSWLPGENTVVDYEKQKDVAGNLINNADILFCLDFNTPSRVEKFEPIITNATCIKVMIDHHLSPSDFCDYTFSYPDACATCELIYDFIVSMGDKALLNKNIASCLYTGIMTDTGSFRFASTTGHVHRIIGDLIDAGAENHKIHQAVYDNSSENRLRFLGFCLSERLQVFPEYHTALIAVSKADLDKYNHQTGDTEGIVNYALGIEGIKMAAFFAERGDLIKISFRSVGSFSVREFSNKHFNGGGHHNASGGRSELTLQATVDKFISLLPEYAEELKAVE